MIRSISLKRGTEVLNIPLHGWGDTGMLVTNIKGLGPTGAKINTASLMGVRGVVYNGHTTDLRVIELEIKLPYASSVIQNREKLYAVAPPGEEVEVRVDTDNDTYLIDGRVAKCEPDIFTQEQTMLIEIHCPNPLWRVAPDSSYRVSISKVNPSFEFPFYNPVESKTLEFSTVAKNKFVKIVNDSDVEVGIECEFYFVGPVKDLAISNETTGQVVRFDDSTLNRLLSGLISTSPFGGSVLPTAKYDGSAVLTLGTSIKIRSEPGDREVRMTKNGRDYNAISAILMPIDWITLVPGENSIAVKASSGSDNIRGSVVIIKRKIGVL